MLRKVGGGVGVWAVEWGGLLFLSRFTVAHTVCRRNNTMAKSTHPVGKEAAHTVLLQERCCGL